MAWKRTGGPGGRRWGAVAAAVVAFSTILVAGEGAVLSATSTTTFPTVADAFVNQRDPGKNFGTGSVIRVEGSPVIRTYARFNVANLPGPVTRATLRVYAKDTNSTGFAVAPAAGSSWGETTITWNNAPAAGSIVASSGGVTDERWSAVDVTPLVVGNGTVTLVLSSTSDAGVRFASREAGSNRAQLVVETGASTSTTMTTTTAPPSSDPVLVAAGDIACPTTASNYNGGVGTSTRCRQKATSDLALSLDPDAVASLGDQQYDVGALAQFQAAYHPSWGRLKGLTRPAAGNHEYQEDTGASGYYTYFGTAAGDPARGYYSYDLGSWHVVVLNSNCSRVGGCGAGSPQEVWLRSDLAAHPAACTLAYWHHPRWSSGQHGSNASVDAFWRALYEAGVDVVLNGHDHHYERFAPQDPAGRADPGAGIRQFVVGTGGNSHYATSTAVANSERRNATDFGVLALTLHAGSYNWDFIPEAGATFTDSGTAACH